MTAASRAEAVLTILCFGLFVGAARAQPVELTLLMPSATYFPGDPFFLDLGIENSGSGYPD